MTSRPTPRLALAAVAALGLYVPTLGLPLPGTCMRTGATAFAAPSPSCSSDLRECLRSAARETIYGARYVPVEDVARCVEAFNSCIHGGASRGGNQADGKKTMPQRFTIDLDYSNYRFDCKKSENAVTCTQLGAAPMSELISDTGELTGSLSGMTLTGTWTKHSENGSDCVNVMDSSIPMKFIFSPDGTATIQMGAYEQRHTYRGGCASVIQPNSDSLDATEWIGKWSP